MTRIFSALFGLFLSLALSLALCLPLTLTPLPAAAQDSGQPSGTISVEDSATRDAAIANRIRDILTELEGYEDVTVTVSSGIVTLRGTTLDMAAANRLNELAGRVEGVVAIENEVSETTDVAARLDPTVQRLQKRMLALINYLPILAVAVLAFAVIVSFGVFLSRRRRVWNRLAPNAFIADIYRQVVVLASVVAGLVMALDILGATALLSTILGAAGLVGLAIGFAVRDTVENFIASVLLSIRQPFRPNDVVEIGGDLGNVIRMTSRATILLSPDGNHIRIPNSTVFKSRIVNYSTNDERRFTFDLGVDPAADLARARELAIEVVAGLPFTLATPAPAAWLGGVGDSTITLTVAGWIDQRDTSLLLAKGEAIRLLTARLDAEGIALPEPTYRLLMPGAEAPALASGNAQALPGGAPQQPPAPAHPDTPAPAADTSAQQEQAIETLVDSEREARAEDDLLSPEPEAQE